MRCGLVGVGMAGVEEIGTFFGTDCGPGGCCGVIVEEQEFIIVSLDKNGCVFQPSYKSKKIEQGQVVGAYQIQVLCSHMDAVKFHLYQ